MPDCNVSLITHCFAIQGVPYSIDYFSRGDRRTLDEQKIIWERRGSKMQPRGDVGKVLVV